jgi:hypothetical protein
MGKRKMKHPEGIGEERNVFENQEGSGGNNKAQNQEGLSFRLHLAFPHGDPQIKIKSGQKKDKDGEFRPSGKHIECITGEEKKKPANPRR